MALALYSRERFVVDSIFGSSWGGGCSNKPLGSYGVRSWKNIRRSCGRFQVTPNFEEGDGAEFSF
jgi:hypothetical protein